MASINASLLDSKFRRKLSRCRSRPSFDQELEQHIERDSLGRSFVRVREYYFRPCGSPEVWEYNSVLGDKSLDGRCGSLNVLNSNAGIRARSIRCNRCRSVGHKHNNSYCYTIKFDRTADP